ncbi:MAG TPA: single-stranded DNA-binding protein [Pirellulales bacterium]
MASFNRVILLGNVTRDPELRYTPSGTAVTDIGLAVNDYRKGPNGESVEETTFVDITLWGRTAEVASEYLNKGAPCLIEGRLKLDQWQDKEGQKRSRLKVIGERLQLLGTKGGGNKGGGNRPPAAYEDAEFGPPANHYGEPRATASVSQPPEDEIPF